VNRLTVNLDDDPSRRRRRERREPTWSSNLNNSAFK